MTNMEGGGDGPPHVEETLDPDIVADLRRELEACEKIGRFVFAFSQLDFTLKALLAQHLNVEERFAEIVTSSLDYARVCTILKGILKVKWTGEEERLRCATNLINDALSLNTEHRLTISHALWTPSNLGLVARRAGRDGGPPSYRYEQPEELTSAIDRAERLMTALLTELGA